LPLLRRWGIVQNYDFGNIALCRISVCQVGHYAKVGIYGQIGVGISPARFIGAVHETKFRPARVKSDFENGGAGKWSPR
tara:strand:- start:233 stop:469 length:237 start_codon:yes stop_codon:yes gene_type:complete